MQFSKIDLKEPADRDKLLLAVTAIVFSVGVFGHLSNLARPLMLLLTPWMLLSFGLLCVFLAWKDHGWAVLAWALPAYILTFILEALGTATSAIFGAYTYGSVLGTLVFGVPPIIGFNWVIVVLACARIARWRMRIHRPLLGSLVVGALCVAFDFALEPLAVALGYWTWTLGPIPLQNYAAWFIIAFFASLPLWRVSRAPRSLFPEGYLIVQTLFFILMRFGLALSA